MSNPPQYGDATAAAGSTAVAPSPSMPPVESAPAPRRRRSVLELIYDFFSSLKLTVVFLGLAVLLVFIGTLAQVDEGLYNAQNRYFRSLVIWWQPHGAGWRLPILPGGYFVGGVLLVNLVVSYVRRVKFTMKKIGLLIIHVGLVLLFLGQFLTDILSHESAMRLAEGESRNYSEDFRANELVLIDKSSDPRTERVYSIPDSRLKAGAEINDPRLPFTVRVKKQWENIVQVIEPGSNTPPMAVSSGATAGEYRNLLIFPAPPVTDTESRNLPGAVVELVDKSGKSLGSYLASSLFTRGDTFTAGGKDYELAMRFTRYYKPFSLQLLKFTHERYTGTDTPKNFASRVAINNPNNGENREVLIYMNNPLRYSGETFYQSGFAPDNDQRTRKVTILQVVHNPSWLTPYLSCVLVCVGLLVQFLQHLVGFVRRRTA